MPLSPNTYCRINEDGKKLGRMKSREAMAQSIDSRRRFLPADAASQEFREGIVGDASKEPSHGASSAGTRQSANAMRRDGPACCVVVAGLLVRAVRLHGALARQKRELGVVDVERRSALKTAFASGLRGLLLAVDENPLCDSRLDVDLDQLVENLIQLFSEIGAIVQSGEDERLEGNFRAVREVLEHRLVCFHSRVSVRQPRADAERLGPRGYTACLNSQYQNS